jgi:Zn-dependent alcohol dehydrogenase
VQDVAQAARELTGGIGVDYAFETAGRAALVQTGLGAVRNGGTVVCVGAPPIAESIVIPLAAGFVISEKKLLGCALGSCNSIREIPTGRALAPAGSISRP